MSGRVAWAVQGIDIGALLQARSRYDDADTGPIWPIFLLMGVWGTVLLACYVFGIWTLVESIRYRDDEFDAVGSSRVLWLVLAIIGLVACQPLGAVAGPLFLVRVRPKLKAWREAHPPPPPWTGAYGYGPPPGYGHVPAHGPAPGYPPPPGSPPPSYPPPGAPGTPPPPPSPSDHAPDGQGDEAR